MKNLRMSKISTKNILKKIFNRKAEKKVKKKVTKKKVAKIKQKKTKKIITKKIKKVSKKVPTKSIKPKTNKKTVSTPAETKVDNLRISKTCLLYTSPSPRDEL